MKLDNPIKCEDGIHYFIAFLDEQLTLKFSNNLRYYRICQVCGHIEFRDKMKEWEDTYNNG